MLHIAEQRKNSNVIEYLLYMWQMEDLIRGLRFDPEALEQGVLSAVEDERLRLQSKKWFARLGAEMKEQGLEVSGHRAELLEIIAELQLLQNTLLTVMNDKAFQDIYTKCAPLLMEFRKKTEQLPKSDVETALTAVYGYLMLKLAKKEISPDTASAMEIFQSYLAYLAKAYRSMKHQGLPQDN